LRRQLTTTIAHVSNLADRITAELRSLIGQPIGRSWRAANKQIFQFGYFRRTVNRMGNVVEIGDMLLHVQCRWRLVDGSRILFGCDDMNRPAEEDISIDDFDWDKHASVLDGKLGYWLEQHRETLPKVVDVSGDAYGAFRVMIEGGFVLEAFPCDSEWIEYSEHWRLLGHRPDRSQFIVSADGIVSEANQPAGENQDDLPLLAIEYHLLQAMESLQSTENQGYRKCDKFLRPALKAAGRWSEAAEVAICNEGCEEPQTKRFYDVLRQLVLAGFVDGKGDLDPVLPAGPRYTECRIARKGLEELHARRGRCVQELELIAKVYEPEDIANRVEYLPLK
jgi:hypothetical protein